MQIIFSILAAITMFILFPLFCIAVCYIVLEIIDRLKFFFFPKKSTKSVLGHDGSILERLEDIERIMMSQKYISPVEFKIGDIVNSSLRSPCRCIKGIIETLPTEQNNFTYGVRYQDRIWHFEETDIVLYMSQEDTFGQLVKELDSAKEIAVSAEGDFVAYKKNGKIYGIGIMKVGNNFVVGASQEITTLT